MELNKTLQGIGLRDVEAKVYLAALELGEAPASIIAKKSRLKRPSVYVILKDLISRGFISSYTRRKLTYFAAQNPKLLIANALEKATQAKTALPQLEALLKSAEETAQTNHPIF